MQNLATAISALALIVSIASLALTVYFQHYRRRVVVHALFRPYLEPGPDFAGDPLPGEPVYHTEYFATFILSNDGNRDVIVTSVHFQVWRDEAPTIHWCYCSSSPIDRPIKIPAGGIEMIQVSCNFADALRAAQAAIEGGADFVKYSAKASFSLIGPRNREVEQTIVGAMIRRGDETGLSFSGRGAFPRVAFTLPLLANDA